MLFVALAGSIFMVSCGGSKNLGDGKAPKGTTIAIPKIKLEDYYHQGINYNSFSGKANLQYQDKKENQKLGATIKMNHLVNIWSSVSAIGGIVEVARAYITPDSLKALLPLMRDAYALPYKEGLALIQAELDFETLQNLFMGNPLIMGSKNATVNEEGAEVIVKLMHNGYQLTITYDKATQLIKQQLITNVAKEFTCLITQTDYKALADKQPFSYNREMVITNKGEEMKVSMNFSKAEINKPANVTFRIPDSYTIKEIK